MFKYQITNVSDQDGQGPARPIFVTESGKLLKPGEFCPANRLNAGTAGMRGLKIDEGAFPALALPKKKKTVKSSFDDEDEDEVKAKVDDGPVGFTDVQTKKRSNIVALKAVGADDEQPEAEAEITSASERDDDDLDGIIPKATRTSAADSSGFVDIKLPPKGAEASLSR